MLNASECKTRLKNHIFRWSRKNRVVPAFAWGRLLGKIRDVYSVDLFERSRECHCSPIKAIECQGLLKEACDLAVEHFRL